MLRGGREDRSKGAKKKEGKITQKNCMSELKRPFLPPSPTGWAVGLAALRRRPAKLIDKIIGLAAIGRTTAPACCDQCGAVSGIGPLQRCARSGRPRDWLGKTTDQLDYGPGALLVPKRTQVTCNGAAQRSCAARCGTA